MTSQYLSTRNMAKLNAKTLVSLAECKHTLRLFLTIALRILSAHNLWRHLARPRAHAY